MLIQSRVPNVNSCESLSDTQLLDFGTLSSLFVDLPALPLDGVRWLRVGRTVSKPASLTINYALLSAPASQAPHTVELNAPVAAAVVLAWEQLPTLPSAHLQPDRLRQVSELVRSVQETAPETVPLFERLSECTSVDSALAAAVTHTNSTTNSTTNSNSNSNSINASTSSNTSSNTSSTSSTTSNSGSTATNLPPASVPVSSVNLSGATGTTTGTTTTSAATHQQLAPGADPPTQQPSLSLLQSTSTTAAMCTTDDDPHVGLGKRKRP
jgi:hypothetical protein